MSTSQSHYGTEVKVGTPATIGLYSDTLAAVVTKVNKKSVVVQRVATTEPHKDMSRDGATNPNVPPVIVAEGILDQITGSPERFALVGYNRQTGEPVYRNGSISLVLGRSVSITDYRN